MTYSQSSIVQRATDPNKNIAVFASAGTGKTHLLVHRILKLLLNDIDPAYILAITFTRKAAAEMRERLMKILADWAGFDDQQLKVALKELSHSDDPSSVSKARKLYEQLLFNKYEIRITTFHAFCQDILKRFALHADVPAGFHLVENTHDLKQEAQERLYKTAHQSKDPILNKALYEILKNGSTVNNVNDILDTFIESRSDWWSYTEDQNDPVSHANSCLRKFLCSESADNNHEVDFSTFNLKLSEYTKLLTLHKNKTNEKNSELISTYLKIEDSRDDSIDIIYPIFFKTDNEPKVIKYSKALEESLGIKKLEQFITLHEELTDIFSKRIDSIKRANLLAFNNAWFYAGNLLLNEYQKVKSERNVLDFDDLEWHTYLLLNKHANASWIQYKLDQRIEHILIDEFQDTNHTQWNLIFPILEELSANLPYSKKSLFFVGDSKQSIYGFRRANPQLQYAAFTWAENNLNAESLETNTSYRSSQAIMNFVNTVFNNKNTPLIKGYRIHETSFDHMWGSVQVNPLIKLEKDLENLDEFRNPLQKAKRNSEIDGHYQEGLNVAAQIKNLVAGRTAILENDQTRALRYRDIIILTRSRNHTPQLEQALQEQNIPYASTGNNQFLKQLEVQDILALLTLLIQPHNDLALVQVLRSPCFSLDDSDLMELANIRTNCWYEKLKLLAKDSPGSIFTTCYEKLQNWRDIANRIPVHDLLDKIYFEINIFERYANSCSSIKKNQVVANLTYLLQLTLDIDAGRYSSIQSFLDSVQKLKESEIVSINTNFNHEDENVVQIMTVHAAKGLEAPVIFLVDTGSSPPKQRAYQSVIHWPGDTKRPEQFFIIGKKESIDKKTQLILNKHLNIDWNEELNLLYVALTRAKQYLFISGVESKRNKEHCWYSIIEQALQKNSCASENGILKFNHGTPPTIKVDSKKPEEKISASVDLSTPIANIHNPDPINNSESHSELIDHGTLVHKLLEILSLEQEDDPNKLRTKVEFALEKDINQDKFNAACEEVNLCLHSPMLKEIFKPELDQKVLSEVPISYFDNDSLHNHIIDRLIISDELIWIIDFKTTSNVSENTMQEQAIHYCDQISNYCSAMSSMYPEKKIRASILFTAIAKLYTFATGELKY